jgi:hypothetical protein
MATSEKEEIWLAEHVFRMGMVMGRAASYASWIGGRQRPRVGFQFRIGGSRCAKVRRLARQTWKTEKMS